eukprot:662228-Alexandrium_andersonii.AAC.1
MLGGRLRQRRWLWCLEAAHESTAEGGASEIQSVDGDDGLQVPELQVDYKLAVQGAVRVRK